MSAPRVRTVDGGGEFSVRVSAGAARDAVAGVHDGRLKLRVAAAPEKGRANRAVLALLARGLDLPVSSLALVRGATARDKCVRVRGLDAAGLRSRLERMLSAREEER